MEPFSVGRSCFEFFVGLIYDLAERRLLQVSVMYIYVILRYPLMDKIIDTA